MNEPDYINKVNMWNDMTLYNRIRWVRHKSLGSAIFLFLFTADAFWVGAREGDV